MRVRAGTRSDVGRVRERNEDAYLAEHPLYAVADGMGGHRGGDVASSLTMETLGGVSDARGLNSSELADRIQRANALVFERAALDRNLEGMGTTVTAIIEADGKIHVAHVGDSRAYLLREDAFRQLTEDHTLVQKMVREGRISAEDAEVHPQRSILTRALGVDERISVDELTLDVRAGDRILLCTDGLSGMVSGDRIEQILRDERDPQVACDRLVDEANRAGGDDNITVVVVDFLGEDAGGETPGVVQAGEAPGGGSGARWRRTIMWVGAVIGIAGLALFAFKLYLDRQWYVGDDGGRVAIYKGIPVEVFGVALSELEERTDVATAEAEGLPTWEEIRQGITAGSREGAAEIVSQIRRDVAHAHGADEEGTGAG